MGSVAALVRFGIVASLMIVSTVASANDLVRRSPHTPVASPGAIRAGLPTTFNERAAAPNARTNSYNGSQVGQAFDSLFGINPFTYVDSAIANSQPGVERLTPYSKIRQLPSIETLLGLNSDVQNEIVCGADGRRRITTTKTIPYRWNCELVITFPGLGQGTGTGWLVGPRCVITAGHCVHGGGAGQTFASRIEVIPGMNGSQRPYGTFVSTKFYSVDGWINNGDPNFDYACIILDQPIGNQLGHFGFANFSTAKLRSMTMNTAGYPGDKAFGTQWFMAGPMTNVSNTVLQYMTDTFGGQSGSSVWTYEAGQRFAFGIHVRGGCPNEATRINSSVYSNIAKWRQF